MTERERLEALIVESEIIARAEKVKAQRLEATRIELLLAGAVTNAVHRLELDVARHRRLAEIEQERIQLARQRLKEIQTDFPTDRAELLAKITTLEAREKALRAMRPTDRSAVDQDELDRIGLRLSEMRKRARLLGALPKEKAA